MGFYNTANLRADDNRFIILTDSQDMPEGPLRIYGQAVQKTITGKDMPVLKMEDKDGNRYTVAAWERDVRRCLLQWGAMDPSDWGPVEITKGKAGRYEIVPCNENPLNAFDV